MGRSLRSLSVRDSLVAFCPWGLEGRSPYGQTWGPEHRTLNLKEHLPPQLAVGKEEVCYRHSRLKYMLICTQAQLVAWGKAQVRLPG